MMDTMHMLVEPFGVQKAMTPVEYEVLQNKVRKDLKAYHIPATNIDIDINPLATCFHSKKKNLVIFNKETPQMYETSLHLKGDVTENPSQLLLTTQMIDK